MPRLVDYRGIYDFLRNNLRKNEIVEVGEDMYPAGVRALHQLIRSYVRVGQLAHLMTFEKFKFNYENPTGSWMLDLSLRAHRDVLAMLHAVHMEETNFSRNCSMRGDTSQKGNWTNFRNERLNQQPFVMTPEWCTNMPHRGSLEFDYVSTTRPPRDVLYVAAALSRGADLVSCSWLHVLYAC